MSFVHLHVHSEFSILDGVATVPNIVETAVNQKSSAIALTDHGNCNGWIALYNECKDKKIKPIFGCEAYFCKDATVKSKYTHLLLLAKNKKGYHNILKMNGYAHQIGFYNRPRIDIETLKKYSEGVICSSACVVGVIAKNISRDRMDKAEKWAMFFKKIFKDDFYLEMQLIDFKEQVKVNKGIIQLSKKLKIPMIVTNDSHYVKKEDSELQDIMLLISQKKTMKDYQEAKDKLLKGENADIPWLFSTRDLYMKDSDDLFRDRKKRHSYIDEKDLTKAINNTEKLAEKVDQWDLDTSPKYPTIDTNGKDIKDVFKKKVLKGYENRGFKKSDEKYWDRLQYELGVLGDHGLEAYFLILADVIEWCKKNDIFVGIGRGSAAASLVSYSLGITGVDPIKHDLMFERFINPGRKEGMPDIDVDFESAKREKVKEYLYEKYGKDKVASVAAYGMLKLKSAIKDVSRVLGGDYVATNFFTSRLNDLVIDDENDPIESIYDLKEKYPSELEKFLKADEIHQKVIDYSFRLKGRTRHISKHPGGVLIAPKSLSSIVALQRKKNEVLVGWTEGVYRKELTTQGLVKYDILGVKVLDILSYALKLIKEKHGKNIDLEKIPLDDEKVYKAMSKGKSLGSFQFETDMMRKLAKEIRPTEFKDLSALNSLDRPGPLSVRMDSIYANLKNGVRTSETEELVKPIMKKIFPDTYGVILYQEQVMQASMKLGGFSIEEADALRKNLVKKEKNKLKEKKLLEDRKILRKKFISNAKKKISKEDAKYIWKIMKQFAGYGFNRPHSVAYALIGYQGMFLKVNYPLEFFTAILSFQDKPEKVKLYMKDALRFGIEILPVDINKSKLMFNIEGDKIRFPVSHLKNIGKSAEKIVVMEEGKKVRSFDGFLKHIAGKRVNKNAIISLIKAGAFDKFESRDKLLFDYLEMKAKKDEKGKAKFKKWGVKETLDAEKEAYEFEFSDYLLKGTYDLLVKEKKCSTIKRALKCDGLARIGGIVRKIKEYKSKNGIMAFIDFQFYDDLSSITVFSDNWNKLKNKIKIGDVFYSDSVVNEYNGNKSFLLSSKDNTFFKKLNFKGEK